MSLFSDYDEAWDYAENAQNAEYILPKTLNVLGVFGIMFWAECFRRESAPGYPHQRRQGTCLYSGAMTITDWDSQRRPSFLMDMAIAIIEGCERTLFVLFPNHGWCVGADDAEDLLEGIRPKTPKTLNVLGVLGGDFSGRRSSF